MNNQNVSDLMGKRVKASGLNNVYDTYILLADPKDSTDDSGFYTIEGTVVFIGKYQDENYKKAYAENTLNNICPAIFIQRTEEFSEGVYYE